MADSTVWDFKYFLKEVLNEHAIDVNLPLCDYLRNIEDYKNPDLTNELIGLFANALWFKSKVAEKLFRKFLIEHHSELLKDGKSYWMCLVHLLDIAKDGYSKSFYESFLFIIATVTGIADFLYRNDRCYFYSHTAGILIDYFDKKLKDSFVSSGGWTELFNFLSGKEYLNFYGMRRKMDFMKYHGQFIEEIDKDCLSIPFYHEVQTLIPHNLIRRSYSEKDFRFPALGSEAGRKKGQETSDLLSRHLH